MAHMRTSSALLHRALLIIALGVVVATVLNLLAVRLLLLPDFLRLEEDKARQSLFQARKLLLGELSHLGDTTADWGVWEDTFEFMRNRNPEYIAKNLTPETLTNLKLNLMALYAPEGLKVWGTVIDSAEKKELPLPPFDAPFLDREHPLLRISPGSTKESGFWPTSAGLLFVGRSPILKSSASEERQGTLLMGRLLDRTYQETLQAMLPEGTTLQAFPSAQTGDALKRALAWELKNHINQAEEGIRITRGKEHVTAQMLLPDIEGRPALLITTRFGTEISGRGELLFTYLLLTIGVSGGLVLLGVGWFFERKVVGPVWRLRQIACDLDIHDPQKVQDCLNRLKTLGLEEKAEVRALAAGLEELLLRSSRQAEELASLNRELVSEVEQRLAAEQRLQQLNETLSRLSRTDALTGLANRRAFDEILSQELKRCQRMGQTLALLLMDVDRFKAFNDTYGHPEGDECLRKLGEVLAACARRPGDLAARYGGEEFAVILPATTLEGAADVAGQIHAGLAKWAIPHTASATGVVTVSIGMVLLPPERESTPEELIQQADKALYDAKQGGRNRTEIAGSRNNTV
ncbi:MAG: diguanylate cyclase [Magnetococcales bacterium]|nr:diguanylate cyclase [Magnetococcales bacterium]